MNEIAHRQLSALASEPAALERTVEYLHSHFSTFLKKREKVLICFDHEPGSIGYLMAQAVLRCGAVPVFPENYLWRTLLREAFLTHCAAIVGAPLLVLGLSKLAKRMETPLYFRNVILAGYPAAKWMIDGIRLGLDCHLWGCFDPCVGPVIAGFSCGEDGGIHIRSEEYAVDIVDAKGNLLPEGEFGEVVLYPVDQPSIRFYTGDGARLDPESCKCTVLGPRIIGFDTIRRVDQELSQLGEQLHMWTSILDCRLDRTGYGLELELVTFPGEKLPKLPSCAKLVIRNWDPDKDTPFNHMYILKNRHFSQDNG